MRLFVAVEVPPGDPGRGPDHLTLRFLGEVESADVPRIRAALERVAESATSFRLTVDGIGAFPSARSPRIVWIGTTEGTTELLRLTGHVRRALQGEGDAPAEERFVPHVTWFRVRSPEDRRRAADLLAGTRAAPAPRTTVVDAFVLKESRLLPGGAVHRTLARFRLTGTDPAADPVSAGGA